MPAGIPLLLPKVAPMPLPGLKLIPGLKLKPGPNPLPVLRPIPVPSPLPDLMPMPIGMAVGTPVLVCEVEDGCDWLLDDDVFLT